MNLENEFDIAATPDQAWNLLDDIPRVIPCMPGAELNEIVDENHFKAVMRVKLGPVSLQFDTDVVREVVDVDDGRRVRLRASARELKGRGSANATIESTLRPTPTGTRVAIATELALQGAVAQYGRSMVGDVAAELTRRFASSIEGELKKDVSGTSPVVAPVEQVHARPVGGLSLMLRAIGASIVRRFKRL